MMNSSSENLKIILEDIMNEYGITEETILYRYTSDRYLQKINEQEYVISAKENPEEMIIDKYKGAGHAYMAKETGPGLAFTNESVDELQKTGRICVKVLVKDILDQGGLIYPVTSVPAYINAFFFTLPNKKVKVTGL